MLLHFIFVFFFLYRCALLCFSVLYLFIKIDEVKCLSALSILNIIYVLERICICMCSFFSHPARGENEIIIQCDCTRTFHGIVLDRQPNNHIVIIILEVSEIFGKYVMTKCDYVIAREICSRIIVIYHSHFAFHMCFYHNTILFPIFRIFSLVIILRRRQNPKQMTQSNISFDFGRKHTGDSFLSAEDHNE